MSDEEAAKQTSVPEESVFDMNATPADIEIKAKAIGRVVDLKFIDPATDICPCCGNIIEKERLDLTITLKDLGFLGSGVSLYFYFIKYCVYFLVIIAVVSSIFNSTMNNFRGYPTNDNFLSNFSTTAGLNFLTTILLMIASIMLRKRMKRLNKLIDIDNVTPSDFTVILTNLTKGTTETEVETYLREHTRNLGELRIIKTVMAYDIARFIGLKHQYQDILNQQLAEKARMKRTKDTSEIKLNTLTEKLKGIERRISEQESGINEEQFQSCGTAFVTFGSDQIAELVVKQLKQSIFSQIWSYFTGHRGLRGRVIYVSRAPEPTDIYWENLCYSFYYRLKNKCITYFLTAVLLTACFFIIFGLSQAKNTVLAFLASLCIFVINNGLGIMIKKLALFEKHATMTYYFIGVAEKSGLAQFLNTTIIVYIIKKIKWQNDIFVTGGLISSVEFITLMNFVSAFSSFWNPFYLKKLWDRRKLSSPSNRQLLETIPQFKAQAIFEGSTFDFAQQLAKTIKVLMFASFYSYVSPLVIFASIITITVVYWMDKIYLLRVCSLPEMLSHQLPNAMTEIYLELMIVIFCVGNMVFENLLFDKQSGWTVAALVLSIIFWVFDFHDILESCTNRFEQGTIIVKQYEDYSYQFLTDYERSNPVTAMKAIEEWQKHLKDSKNNTNLKRKATQSIFTNYAMSRPGMTSTPYFNQPFQRNSFMGFGGSSFGQGNQFFGFNPMNMQMNQNKGFMNPRQVFPMQMQQQQQQQQQLQMSPQDEIQQAQNQIQQLQSQLGNIQNPMEAIQIVNTIENKKRRITYLQTMELRGTGTGNNSQIPMMGSNVRLSNPLTNQEFNKPNHQQLQNPLVVQSSHQEKSYPHQQLNNPLVIPQQPQVTGMQQQQGNFYQQQPQQYPPVQQPPFGMPIQQQQFPQQQQFMAPMQPFNNNGLFQQQQQYQPIIQQNQNSGFGQPSYNPHRIF